MDYVIKSGDQYVASLSAKGDCGYVLFKLYLSNKREDALQFYGIDGPTMAEILATNSVGYPNIRAVRIKRNPSQGNPIAYKD